MRPRYSQWVFPSGTGKNLVFLKSQARRKPCCLSLAGCMSAPCGEISILKNKRTCLKTFHHAEKLIQLKDFEKFENNNRKCEQMFENVGKCQWSQEMSKNS